jgi:hypothetical protein
MKTSLKLISLIIASLFLFNLSSTAHANALRGSNTKIEADKVGKTWKISVCTIYSTKNHGRPMIKALGNKKMKKIGNKVIKMFNYRGSKLIIPKKDYWGKKIMRCYLFTLDPRPLTGVKATWVRQFLKPGSKPPVLIVIGRATGVVTLNV